METNRLGNIYGENKGAGFAGNVWNKEFISPTLTTMQGGGREPMILETIRKNVADHNKNAKHQQDLLRCEWDEVAPCLPAGTHGSTPHLTKTVMVRQATKEGFIPCKIGGGGRSDISNKPNTQGQSNRPRECESDSDNGESP